MIRNKNEATKISNIFFIAIGFMSFLSLMTLIFGGVEGIDGFNKNDYNYNLIMMAIYTVLSGLTLYITNKKINVYKDEYPVSRRVFNLFIAISIMSVIITFSSNILTMFSTAVECLSANIPLTFSARKNFGFFSCKILIYS